MSHFPLPRPSPFVSFPFLIPFSLCSYIPSLIPLPSYLHSWDALALPSANPRPTRSPVPLSLLFIFPYPLPSSLIMPPFCSHLHSSSSSLSFCLLLLSCHLSSLFTTFLSCFLLPLSTVSNQNLSTHSHLMPNSIPYLPISCRLPCIPPSLPPQSYLPSLRPILTLYNRFPYIYSLYHIVISHSSLYLILFPLVYDIQHHQKFSSLLIFPFNIFHSIINLSLPLPFPL